MSELALQLIHENIAKHERGEDASYLDLGKCGLSHLPRELGECIWLETLILSNSWYNHNNFISKMSQNRGKLNHIVSIEGLERLRLLKNLAVSGNVSDEWELQDLSPVSDLVNLQYINCSYTEISDLSALYGLIHLQSFKCAGTQVSDFSPLKNLANIKDLILSELNWTSSSGSRKVIDSSILKSLNKLRTLWVSDFNIRSLDFISSLKFLEDLNICNTESTNFNMLSNLRKLKSLNFSCNAVNDLKFVKHLNSLQYLDFASTDARDLSPLSELFKLQRLNCFDTRVSDLSPINHLIDKGIPVKLEGYSVEIGIHVADCPLTNPPREIVEQGNEAILNYFAEKERTGTEKSLEAKVVLIGEGQAGKTSLRTRLLSPGAALPNKEDRTKGLDIDIEKYQYPLTNGEIMRLNVFDFGGQDHYKPLHQFFYSKNTLYVLVSKNGDTTVNDFDYWLDTAQLFGQNSPVLLVHNLFGDVRSSFNRQKYARFDETIKECLDVNLGDFADKRWNEVQSRIEYFASRLPHVHEEIPKSWANVRRALAARREEQVLDLEDYLALCALEENGAMDEARAMRCSAYLHDIGIILHYQDDPDLREYVIVKNEWASDAAYRVIDDPAIAERKGRFFRQSDLPRIWHQPEYRRMRPQLLQLMRNFRLCYPLKAEGEFIAPQLLPASPPQTYVWQPDQDLILYIEYDFMPLGLMSQLIVECHLLIAEERQLVWRDGAVLELPSGEACAEILLQKRNGKQTIGIRAQGRKKRELMTVVDAKLEELHQPFGQGLKVEKKIPCVCKRCAYTDDKWFFNLSELENRQKAGRKTKECEISFDSVSIDALLGNVFSEAVRKRGRVDVPRAFFSYSKKDLAYLQEFKKHLNTYSRNGELLLWDDTKIRPGEEWDDAIKEELAQADFIFLLVSVDFLNTDYIWDTEIPEAIRRHHAKEATVIPIKIRSCEWSNTPLAGLQGLPRKDGLIDTPINDRAWTEVVQEIGKLLKRGR